MSFSTPFKMLGLAARIALLGMLAGPLPAAMAADDFLPPEQVFHHSARVDGDRVIVTWRVEPGHYLYKQRMSFAAATPGVTLGLPAWPKGESHKDEFFGEQEVFRGSNEFPVPFTVSGTQPRTLELKLKFQGCADAGLCYPPTTWNETVALPAAASAASPPAAGGSLLSRSAASSTGGLQSPAASTQQDDEFLPPDEAFRFVAEMKRPDSVELNWAIADGYYLYKKRVSVSTDSDQVQVGQPLLPQGKAHTDEFFGDSEVYFETLQGTVPVARAAGSSGTLNLKVTYQGCAEEGLCYLPITKTVALDLPPTDTASSLPPVDGLAAPGATGDTVTISEQDRLAGLVRDGNLALMLVTFFGLGILLSLTPCVLPMIPILSGIIAGQGNHITPARSFSLAFTYVQGMALTYAAAGAVFALVFKTAPQATFQQPWIITLFAVLFVAMALAMFGTYTLQMPSALQSRLTDASNRQRSGSYVGTFIMGALSSLIVTACVAPVIVAALSVIAQTGNLARGAGALYATGIGMGVPLLVVGASAGSLLPRVGPWMDTIKSLFGVMFLGVAIYVATPLLPDALVMLLWSALAVISGFWVFSMKARDGAPASAPLRGTGLLAIFYGIILLIGTAAGGKDPLQPLKGTLLAGNAPGAAAAEGIELKRIKSVEDLDREIAAAVAAKRPVMLDFYADWCVSCKEMEKYTFTDAGVRATLAAGVLLQADVTANDEVDQVLLKRFGIFGPPTIAFFGADGVERPNHRLVGFVPAARFRDHVAEAFAPSI
jgi:thiol:disulfide interchange protein DsbD